MLAPIFGENPVTKLDEQYAIVPGSRAMPVAFAEGAGLDAFGRLRVSNPLSLFQHQNLYGLDEDIFEAWSVGAGSGISYIAAENSTLLTCGANAGDHITRQTFHYFPYAPGKSQLIQLTGVMQAGLTDIRVCKRSGVAGMALVSVSKADWNYDKLDGTGPSGKILDPTKAQIYYIDFQYLGVGTVRFGFVIDRTICICHILDHANSISSVYMTTPVLPVRYEIRNLDGVSLAKRIGYFDDTDGLYFEGIAPVANNTMKQICSCVTSEGGIIPEGEQFSQGHGTTTIAVTTRRPVFAIRMKGTLNSKDNRKIARLLHTHVHAATNDAFIEVVHGHGASAITGAWISAGSDSGVEYSSNISAITFVEAHDMSKFYAPAGGIGQAAEATQESSDIRNEHDRISQNHDCTMSTYIVVYATSMSLTSNVSCSQGWIEY